MVTGATILIATSNAGKLREVTAILFDRGQSGDAIEPRALEHSPKPCSATPFSSPLAKGGKRESYRHRLAKEREGGVDHPPLSKGGKRGVDRHERTESALARAAAQPADPLTVVRGHILGLPVRLESLGAYPPMPEPVEDADSFEGNARLKALHYARLTDCWTLADDSGLEVDALGGQPGVYSSRYAGSQCDPAANNARLVKELANVAVEKRTARFRCVVALAKGSEVLATAWGQWEGLIVDEARGSNGFGYDPHFFVPTCGMTAAEMPPEQKNRLSHRARALAKMRGEIERLLRSSTPVDISDGS